MNKVKDKMIEKSTKNKATYSELSKNNQIFEYIKKRNRDGKMEKIGVLVGIKDNVSNSFSIGWSKVNKKMGDKFDKIKGFIIAKNRCQASPTNLPSIPVSIKNKFRQFEIRCSTYFKQAKRANKGSFLN